MILKTAPQVHIETFGCQMNESDSELVRSMLKREGFGFTEDRERAERRIGEHLRHQRECAQ